MSEPGGGVPFGAEDQGAEVPAIRGGEAGEGNDERSSPSGGLGEQRLHQPSSTSWVTGVREEYEAVSASVESILAGGAQWVSEASEVVQPGSCRVGGSATGGWGCGW